MSLPYDAALKELVQSYPRDWLAAVGVPVAGPVTAVNVDLATVSAAADAVFAVGDPPAYLVTLEFQASRDASLSRRVLVYNALLHQRFAVPVQSVVVLLRRAASDSALDGAVRYAVEDRLGGMDFRFEVVRVWERPAAELLRGAVGTLPLAPLGALPAGTTPGQGLPAVVRAMHDRLTREFTPPTAEKLLAVAFVLTGLRVSEEDVVQLYRGVGMLEESTAVQYLLRQGAIREVRKLVIRLGRRLGEPDATTAARLEAIGDLDELERLCERLPLVSTWPELFDVS